MKNSKLMAIALLIAFLLAAVYPVVGTEDDTNDQENNQEEMDRFTIVQNTLNHMGSLGVSSIQEPSIIMSSNSLGSFEYGLSQGSGTLSKKASFEFEDELNPGTFFNPYDIDLSGIENTNTNLGSPDIPITPGGGGDDEGEFYPAILDSSLGKNHLYLECSPFTLGTGTSISASYWMRNSGYGYIEFEISENCPWITSIYPTKGILLGTKSGVIFPPGEEYDGVISERGGPIDINLDIDVSNLEAGTHSYPIIVTLTKHHWARGDMIVPAPEPMDTNIPVKLTLWADPTQGPSPRYKILGTESRHIFELGWAYWDANSEISFIVDIWDEGINPVDSFTSTVSGFEVYDLNLDLKAEADNPYHGVSLTSPMSIENNGLYSGEHRYIKAKVFQKEGSLELNFEGIGTYDLKSISRFGASRAPGHVRICFCDENFKNCECGPVCPIPKLYWANPYVCANSWMPIGISESLGNVPLGNSASSCFVAWNPVAYATCPQGIGWEVFPTTQTELDIWGIDLEDIADYNGETECPMVIGRQAGHCMGGGSPFGEGRFERLDRATWAFSTRSNLPTGHYKIPLSLMYEIKNFAQDANGNWYHLLMLFSGFLSFEFDVVETAEDWPPLSQTPDFWGVFEDENSVEYFDISGNNDQDILFTPLSSQGGWGKHGPIIPPDEETPNNWGVVYDIYPKKPIDWCQLYSSNGYNEDFTFANEDAKNEGDAEQQNSALIIGVRDIDEDLYPDRPDWPTLGDVDIQIGDVLSDAFLVAGGCSGNIFNLILETPPVPPGDDDDDVPPGDDDDDVPPGDDDDDIVDSDGDGIDDSVDNCPYTPNPDQADSDGDGIGDVCDNDGDDDIPPSDDDDDVPPSDDDDDVPPGDDDDEEEITIADLIQKFLSKEISFIDMILGIFSILFS